jgi:glycosyltransferase involved in cell wall biosynthesis
MRVMLLVTDLERGGAPLRIARLARGLARAGDEVHVGCLGPRGPVSADLDAAGIATFACEARSPRDLLALKRLAGHVQRIRPDVIHATLTHANVAARLVGTIHRVPVIASTATVEIERASHRVLERASTAMDRAHIVNSRVVAEHVVKHYGVPSRNVFVVPPSLDPMPIPIDRRAARAQLGLPKTAFVVAWVGRLDPVKRCELIVRTAAMYGKERVRFVIAGEGPERSRLAAQIEALGARRTVLLTGWLDDPVVLLSAADAFVFPSLTEGMPNAVLEAMACGVPIVASNIPVLRELSAGGERFVLVSGDDPEDYAAALRSLRSDAQLRRTLGRRAARWAEENLRPEQTIAEVRRIYAHVLR